MAQIRDLLVDNVLDPAARQSFKWVQNYLQTMVPLLSGDFTIFEIEFKDAVTALSIPHNLPFIPTDIIQTYVTNGATVTWLYEQFTNTNFVITTSGACKVRFLAGKIV